MSSKDKERNDPLQFFRGGDQGKAANLQTLHTDLLSCSINET